MSLKRNTIWNFAGMGLPLLVGLVTIPYLVRTLGIEAFGILTLIWALVGYFSLFDFGLGRALTQRIASYRGSSRESEIPQLAKAGLLFCAGAGVIGALVFAILAQPLALDWLEVSPDLEGSTITSLLMTSLGVPLTTLATGLRGVSEAYEDFKAVNILRIALGVSTFGLPVVSVALFGPSLVFVVAALLLARLLALIGYWLLAYRRLPAAWLRCPVRFAHVKRLSSFGAWMTVSNIVNPIMVTADRFVIAGVLGAGVVAYYTVPAEVMLRLLILPAALSMALFPRLASRLLVDRGEAQALYVRCIKLVIITLGAICLLIGLGSYWGLLLWLGPDFASQSWAIVSVLSLGILFNGVAHVPTALIEAAGEVRYIALINVGLLFLYVPLLFGSIYEFGVMGAAIAWVVRAALELTLLLGGARRVLRVSGKTLGLKYV